jgi:hypothetical protein
MSEKKNTGLRFNAFKLGMSLIPFEWRIELARVFTLGSLKYKKNNWLGGMDWSVPMDCAERHYTKWAAGETVDPDTGCHHLALAAWNLLSLMTFEMRGLGTDDRVPHGLAFDENFNWTSGPAASMGLGKTPEEMQAIVDKYAKLRDGAKPQSALAPGEKWYEVVAIGQLAKVPVSVAVYADRDFALKMLPFHAQSWPEPAFKLEIRETDTKPETQKADGY